MRHADELQDGDVSGSGRGGASDVMGDLARSLQQRHESVEDTLSAITSAGCRGLTSPGSRWWALSGA